jgi:NAD(P)-dependent dehydrogenase (short-subunit alcohol dehydrogenase family)
MNTGPTMVITGASSGTGAQAARQLAALGAQVVIVGRDPARTAAVADAIGGSGAHIARYTADFARLDSVRTLADALTSDFPKIDVLLDNAGGAYPGDVTTVDGNEVNYQVNALSPFLLITSLTPALEGGLVVSTSSRSHRGATLTCQGLPEQLDRPTGMGAHRRYARAKLAALLLHREHQRRHPDLSMIDVHPGIVASDFGRYLGRTGTVLTHLSRPFLLSPRSAATALVSLAMRRTHESRYFNRLRPATPSPLADDLDLARCVYDDALRRLDPTRSSSDGEAVDQ